MLEVLDIHTYYGASHVIRGASFEVKRGEVLCLLGRNGAGKSTTVASIMGMVIPRGGIIRFEGVEITSWSAERRARLGISLVPQGRRIFPLLTVEENLTIGMRSAGRGWTLERAYDLFPRLAERRSSMGDTLSGGEQQMLAIARSLLSNPKMILMDEPSEGLAPRIVDEVYRIVATLKREGFAILLVEHSLEQAVELADRICILSRGRVGFSADDASELTREVRERLLGVG